MPEGRERDRYARASFREQAGDTLKSLRRNPGITIIIVLVLGGWLFLNLATPAPVDVRDLQAGDCLYLRAADADSDTPTGRPAGTSMSALEALATRGAERAPCDGSHSHEVVLQTVFPDIAGAAFPGQRVLWERSQAACEEAFEAYVGRPVEGSSLELLVYVPNEEAWANGARAAPCLVGDPNGQFLLKPAKGSGL
jgi:hypothetical protein